MRRRISRAGIALTAMALLVVFAFVMILVVPVVQARNLPEPDGTRVMDLAGVLDPDDEETLTAQIEELADNARLNVAVVTVDSLGGESAAQYARRLYRYWDLERTGPYGGVLVLLAPGERQSYVASGGAMADWLSKNGGAMPTMEQCQQLIAESGYGQGTERILDQVSMRAKGYRYSAEAMASGGTVSTLELLAPVWVLLGLGLLLALVVCQERGFFFKRQENRGGIFRPMYNVGGGSLGGPNISARGRN